VATKSSSTNTDPGWTDLLNSLSTPVALLQPGQQKTFRLLRSNKAFQLLFQLGVSGPVQGIKQFPQDLIHAIRIAADQQSPCIWQQPVTESCCRQFKLICDPVLQPASGLYLLQMQEVSEQETALQLLKTSNNELRRKLSDIERLKNRIREQSIRDPLTNLYNRRFLNEFMERELALARRNQKPLAVVMLDLDHFKQLNDKYGHQAGDKVIEMVAKHLLSQSRRTDILFRYGGEEFLLILPNTNALQARQLADNWRRQVERSQIYAKHQPISTTLSAGVAVYPDHGTTTFNLIQTADEALYRAKAAGRNQVVLS
jgi:diguanylate cyclase (GGDEF)-like protein